MCNGARVWVAGGCAVLRWSVTLLFDHDFTEDDAYLPRLWGCGNDGRWMLQVSSQHSQGPQRTLSRTLIQPLGKDMSGRRSPVTGCLPRW
jgi:hypothetical protein